MTARSRVERLLEGARVLRDPASPLGRRARAELPKATRLSPEGVELALSECLETEPTDAEPLGASVALEVTFTTTPDLRARN